MTDLFQCCNLLKDFISEKLDGDIENFKQYNFLLLENDKKFGRCSEFGTGFDPDDTEIARAVYYLIFSNKVHDTDLDFSFSDIGTHKKYRGDTLNTFNTLFGENMERAVKYSNNDTAFIKEVEQFKNKCYVLGNFTMLPNLYANGQTINLYRGNWNTYKDYFDVFLYELNKCYEDAPDKDKTLSELMKANSFYFDIVNSMELFKRYNFLFPYFTTEGTIRDPFRSKIENWDREPSRYVVFAYNYICISEHLIDMRIQAILRILKRIIANVEIKIKYDEINRKFENGKITKEQERSEKEALLRKYDPNRKKDGIYWFMKYEL